MGRPRNPNLTLEDVRRKNLLRARAWRTRTKGTSRQVGTHFPVGGGNRGTWQPPNMEITRRPSIMEQLEAEDKRLAREDNLQRLKDESRRQLERLVELTHSSDEITRAQAKAEIERRFPAEYRHLFGEEPRPAALLAIGVPAAQREEKPRESAFVKVSKGIAKTTEWARREAGEAAIRSAERRERLEKAQTAAEEARLKREGLPKEAQAKAVEEIEAKEHEEAEKYIKVHVKDDNKETDKKKKSASIKPSTIKGKDDSRSYGDAAD